MSPVSPVFHTVVTVSIFFDDDEILCFYGKNADYLISLASCYTKYTRKI